MLKLNFAQENLKKSFKLKSPNKSFKKLNKKYFLIF